MTKIKKKGSVDEPKYIKSRECDVSMARSKRLLPCDHNCKQCHACIEVFDTGERQHVNLRTRGGKHD